MKKMLGVLALAIVLVGCGSPEIPEMKEFMQAVNSPDQLTAVVGKYAVSKDIVPDALSSCELGKPKIKDVQKKGDLVIYSVEAKVIECEKSENAVGTIRIFDIGWKNGKIVQFDWQGPKSGKVEY